MSAKEELKVLANAVIPQTERNAKVKLLNDFFKLAEEEIGITSTDPNACVNNLYNTDEHRVFVDKLNNNIGLFIGDGNKLDVTMERNHFHELLNENLVLIADLA